MRTHGGLTEDSRSYPVVTPDRKGREGKGREVGHSFIVSTGRRQATFRGYVSAVSCPGMNEAETC
jgi:hypothetical protein